MNSIHNRIISQTSVAYTAGCGQNGHILVMFIMFEIFTFIMFEIFFTSANYDIELKLTEYLERP